MSVSSFSSCIQTAVQLRFPVSVPVFPSVSSVPPPAVYENTTATGNVLSVKSLTCVQSGLHLQRPAGSAGGGRSGCFGIQTHWFQDAVHMSSPSNCQSGAFDHDRRLPINFTILQQFSSALQKRRPAPGGNWKWRRMLVVFSLLVRNLRTLCLRYPPCNADVWQSCQKRCCVMSVWIIKLTVFVSALLQQWAEGGRWAETHEYFMACLWIFPLSPCGKCSAVNKLNVLGFFPVQCPDMSALCSAESFGCCF